MKSPFKTTAALLLCAALTSGSMSPAAAQVAELAADGGGVSLGPIIIDRAGEAQAQNPLQEKLSLAPSASVAAEPLARPAGIFSGGHARASITKTWLRRTPAANRARFQAAASAKPGDFQALESAGKAVKQGAMEEIDALFLGQKRMNRSATGPASPSPAGTSAEPSARAAALKPFARKMMRKNISQAKRPALKPAPKLRTPLRLLLGAAALFAISILWHHSPNPNEERLLKLDQAIAQGTDYLIKEQGPDGSWGNGESGNTSFNNSHVRVPITAMAIEALETARPPEAEKAIEKGSAYVFAMMLKRRRDLVARKEVLGDNNFQPYALAYGLSALVAQYRYAHGDAKARCKQSIEAALHEILASNLAYEDALTYYGSFEIAVMAHSLQQAQAAGFTLPKHPKKKGTILDVIIHILERSRLPDGGFPYYAYTAAQDKEDSAARDPLIELVLYKAHRSTLDKLRAAVDRFFKSQVELKKILTEVDDPKTYHKHAHGWAKYFYLFGLYWTAEALKELPPGQDRTELAQRLADAVLRLRKDGKWVDSSAVTGPNYGAASAVLILKTARELIGPGD